MNIVEEYTSSLKKEDIVFKYSYKLTKLNYKNSIMYGIEVERKDYVGEKNVNLERDSVKYISTKVDSVKRILMKLYSNQVSPIHFIDVAGTDIDCCASEV